MKIKEKTISVKLSKNYNTVECSMVFDVPESITKEELDAKSKAYYNKAITECNDALDKVTGSNSSSVESTQKGNKTTKKFSGIVSTPENNNCTEPIKTRCENEELDFGGDLE